MGTKRAGRDAKVDRCPECGAWRLSKICQPCATRSEIAS